MSTAQNTQKKNFLARAYHRAFSLGALRPHATVILPFLDKPGGTFVEIGARDGLKKSLTPYLEKALGWQGLLVEPWPHLFHKCRKNRRRSVALNVAAVENDLKDSCIDLVGLPPDASIRRRLLQEAAERQSGKPLKPPVPGAAAPKRIHYVSTNSLGGILDRANFESSFDLIALNLLGYESKALEGMDFQKYKPTFVMIRAANDTRDLPNLPTYYERVASSPHDERSTLHLFRFADFGAN